MINWMTHDFSIKWLSVKSMLPQLPQLSYLLNYNTVLIKRDNKSKEVFLGRLEELSSRSETYISELVLHTLGLKTQEEERKEKMAYEQDRMIEKAREDGEFWGTIAAKALPNLTRKEMWQLAMRGGKLAGYSDVDSNNAFQSVFLAEFEEREKTVVSIEGPKGK